MTQIFLSLLKLGISTAKTSDEECQELLEISMQEWRKVMALAERQGVQAIAIDGLHVLIESHKGVFVAQNENPVEWQMWLLENIGQLTRYEMLNHQQKKVIAEISEIWAAEGILMMVFKGQANASMYPKPEHRAVGDIDCWLTNLNESENAYGKGNEVLRKAGAVIDEGWYRHSKIAFKGETIENHRVMSHTRGSKLKQEMESELRALANDNHNANLNFIGKAVRPSAQFNACFLTYHGLHHFLSEGLRMKQILDWAIFLQKEQEKVDWDAYWVFCKRYKLERFAEVMNYIVLQYLNINANFNRNENQNHNKEDVRVLAEKVLWSTLYDDDYLFNSGKSDWMVRWLLVKNMLTRDRWKYRDVAQESVLKHLWQNVTGYLFDKE